MIIQKYTIGQSVFIEDDLNIVNNCIGTVIKTFKNNEGKTMCVVETLSPVGTWILPTDKLSTA